MPPKAVQQIRRIQHNARQLIAHPELLAHVLRSITGAIKGQTITNIDMAGSLALQENTTAYTISSGVLDIEEGSGQNTASCSFIRVDTEGGAGSDDLDTIDAGRDGQLLILKLAQSDHVVTLKAGTGNLSLDDDVILDNAERFILLVYSDALSLWLSPFFQYQEPAA